MGVWVGLLRGVNVGGAGKLPMADLRAIAEGCGFEDVRTYIQSGNIVFSAGGKATDVERRLLGAIEETAGLSTTMALRSAKQLAAVVDGNPFADRTDDHKQLHVAFLADKPDAAVIKALGDGSFAPEELAAGRREVYFLLPGGLGRSKLATEAAKRGGPVKTGTMRNWRTVTTLLTMADETG